MCEGKSNFERIEELESKVYTLEKIVNNLQMQAQKEKEKEKRDLFQTL